MAMFRRWFDEAVAAGLHEPNAMVVATADADGRPSARIVLLKGLDERGFVFFTNTRSRKGEELAANPRCALLFPWHPLERQVRVDGTARRCRGPTWRRTSPPGRAAPSSAPGPRTSRGSVAGRERARDAYGEAEARYPEATYRSPTSGAGTS